jgi:hypothetical protein
MPKNPAKKVVNVTGVKHTVKKSGKDVVVEHPDGMKVNLSKVAEVKTVSEGVKATKKWHKTSPHSPKNVKKKD